MARSRSPARPRSRERLSRSRRRHSSSRSRSVAGSSKSRSRSRSKSRSTSRSRSRSRPRSRSRSPLKRTDRSSGDLVDSKQRPTLRRGNPPPPRSPRRAASSSRSPKRSRHSSKSLARRHSSSGHDRHKQSVSNQDRHASPGDRSRHHHRSKSPGYRSSPEHRSSRQHDRSRSNEKNSRGNSKDRRDSRRDRRDSSREMRDSGRDRNHYERDDTRWQDHGAEYHHDSRRDSRWQQQQRYPEPPRFEAAGGWDRHQGGAPAAAGGGRGYYRGDDGRRPPPLRAHLSDEPPGIGSIHPGVVHTVKPFGVFVAIEGHWRHVFVHHSQVSDQVVLSRSDDDNMKVKALEYAAPPGQKVWVKVLEVSPDNSGPGFRVHGSMMVVDQDSGQDLDPSGQTAAAREQGQRERLSDAAPEVGTCHRAEVKRIEAYGVFVALQGYRRYGLVHASQVANYLEFSADDNDADRKKALSDVVELGQPVWVKVVEVTDHENPRGPKIGCSMKLVDQSDGADLDPQNLRYRPRGDAGYHPQSKAPIGASAGEVKGGTVDWGFLATRPDAFGSAGYDLLGDEPGSQRAGPSGPGRPHAQPQQQQQQQQYLPPVGRGRGAVMPAWMTNGPAAPGSRSQREDEPENRAAAAADLTLEEALRIVQAASSKKKHKDKHKKHKKHRKSSKDHKKSHKRSKDKKGHSSSSGSSSRGR